MATNGNFLLDFNLKKKEIFLQKLLYIFCSFIYQRGIDWLLWGPESVLDARYLVVLLESSLLRQWERLRLSKGYKSLEACSLGELGRGLHKKRWHLTWCSTMNTMGFPGGPDRDESTCNAGDWGSIAGWGGSTGEENGNPLQ